MNDTCEWSFDEYSGCWDTSCEQSFYLDDGTPEENSFRFCPYCGSRLTQRAADGANVSAESDESDGTPRR